MGGCTITKVADSVDDLLKEMKEQVYGAIRAGLWPDSELIVLRLSTQETIMYTVQLDYVDENFNRPPDDIQFIETSIGRAFHVGIAAMYGPKPEPGQYVGTVHAHT